MKIKIKNLGILKQGEFTLGDLTIICGKNNTGKTYVTYSLFGFLNFWNNIINCEIEQNNIQKLLSEGIVQINLQQYLENSQQIIEDGCRKYIELLPFVFSSPENSFKNTTFSVDIDLAQNKLNQKYEEFIGSTNKQIFSLEKKEDSPELLITLLSEDKEIEISENVIKKIISSTIKHIVFAQFFPNSFIVSAERTGTAIFRQELETPRILLHETRTIKYPLAVKKNLEFIKELDIIVKQNSFIIKEYPEILNDFTNIIGGIYNLDKNDQIYFIPTGKKIKLSMDESSSAVRSLLDLGFYLKHIAKKGDLLIIDEPELNLHPENQRLIARLLARLINLDIKVLITTHSDYIIKELNTLIMLNQDKPYLQEIALREGYRKEELLCPNQLKVYIAKEDLMVLDNRQRRTRCQTLVEADITPNLGIEVSSFDDTIETMNRIQDEIIWGG
ncbi:AAA family ATPase [Geminocystis sp. CENA526]|uniref:AAA family ATPase n=1 Tax=Geminocystis sp. CENA526 TaxID=1355871 RepID=UPI003D6E0CA1